MALITGDLASTGVPELFRAVADEQRTGRLTLSRVETTNGQFKGQESLIYFRDGDTYHARLVASGIRLGDRLISAGLVTQEEIDEALQVQSAEGGQRRLGQVLLDSKTITFEQLEAIVRQQIEDTIFEILRWDGGHFTFEPDLYAEEDIGIKASVENLVMEGARRFREWHHISRLVPTLEAVPRFNEQGGGAVEVALTPEEWSFVSRVDGRHTITELAKGCGFTGLEAGRTVFGLVTAGLLVLDLPSGVEVPLDDPEIEAAFDELEKAIEEASRGEGRATRTLAEIGTVIDTQAAPKASDAEPEPVAIPEPEPVAIPEPAPVAIPEPEPVAIAEEFAPAIETTEVPEIQIVRHEPEAEEIEAEAERELAQVAAAAPEVVDEAPEDAEEDEIFSTNGSRQTWSVIAPAAAPDGSTPVEQFGPATVVAEESVDQSDPGSYARLFAELSAGDSKKGQVPAKPEPKYADDDEDQTEAEEREPESPAPPVDPMVDTSSLIREFSALGMDDDSPSELPGFDLTQHVPASPRKSPPSGEKGRGFFGRKRR